MNIRLLVRAFLVVTAWYRTAADTDPCHQNYGGCDKQHGLCWTTSVTTHFCTCKAGYKPVKNKRSHLCTDVNECKEEKVCDENFMCENTAGSYACHCRCGYVKDYTGQKCLNALHITGGCFFPISCYHGMFWWRSSVSFDTKYARSGYLTDMGSPAFPRKQPSKHKAKCSCESGFRLNHCGFCEDVNECAESHYYCTGTGSKCVNTEGSYYCECKIGYALGPSKKRCYADGVKVPNSHHQSILTLLSNSGRASLLRFAAKPYIIHNFRWCPEGVTPGNTSVVSFDLDSNGKNDVTFTWVCARGQRSVLINYAKDEAKWDQWTCWTACKPTCWGGLQTRSRKCLHGLPGLKGCMGRGSESRECYTGPKCPYRVRKDATQLTDAETRDLVQAMRKYKNDPTVRGFRNAASAHGFPGQCNRRGCCRHGAKLKFLAWHRSITLNFEEGIARFLRNKSLGIPYWNWLAKNPQPPAIVWKKHFARKTNPFANMTVRTDLGGPMLTIQRDKKASLLYLNASHDTWTNTAVKLAKTYSLHQFAEALENVHNKPHVSACEENSDRCTISMASIWYAAFDPLFMFHHSQVDRLWAVAQKKIENEGATTWTTQTALELSEEPGDFGRRQMPFGNKSLNAFPILQAVNTKRDSYYYKELTGVKYDYLENDGFPASPLFSSVKKFGSNLQMASMHRIGGAEMLFVSQYLKSITGTRAVYINYYRPRKCDVAACSQITSNDTHLGRYIFLPNSNQYNNSVPTLSLTKHKTLNLDPDEDMAVVACYTNRPNCIFNCPAASNKGVNELPSPGLMYRLPNLPVDVYKFDWSVGKRMPSWPISLKSALHWIYFYGSRAASIYQVSTAKEWHDCSASLGRPFRCSFVFGGNVCVLPVGTYYLVDRRWDFCRQGLRMVVAARM